MFMVLVHFMEDDLDYSQGFCATLHLSGAVKNYSTLSFLNEIGEFYFNILFFSSLFEIERLFQY